MSITEFLEARIAEDEAAAGKLAGVAHSAKTQVYTGDEWVTTPLSTERVLAECAAKRAILADHNEEMTHWWPEMVAVQVCGRCGDGTTVEWPCPTIAALAAVYKDHPDYQQEWAS